MKKQFIFGSFLALGHIATAQFNGGSTSSSNIYRDGKTGFGMTTAPSTYKIEVETATADDGISITQKSTTSGSRGSAALYLKNVTGHNWGLFSMGTDNNIGATHFAIYDLYSSSPRFFISGADGKIGIGTTTPTQPLDVTTAGLNTGINITQTTGNSAALHLTNSNTGGNHWALFSTGNGSSQGAGHFSIYDYGSGIDRLFINSSSGNVGVGTNLPGAKLDVTGNLRLQLSTLGNPGFEMIQSNSPTYSRFRVFGDGRTMIGFFSSPGNDYDPNGSILTVGASAASGKALNIVNNTTPSAPSDLFTVYGTGATEIKTSVSNATDYVFTITDPVANTKNFSVKKDGSAVIAGDYLPAGYKLSVNGKAIFEEVWVRLRADWPDYVFNKNYALMPIGELANYIEKNNHLPGFNSAREMEKNTPYSVNEMQTKLLEKVEELTLYIIQLEKQLKEIKNDKQ